MVTEHIAALSRRQQGLLACIFLFFSGYVCYTAMVEPKLAELHAVRANLDAQQQLLAEKRLRASERRTEQEKCDHLREQLDESYGRFFSADEGREFLAGLDALARSAKCQLVAIDVLSREAWAPTAKQENAEQTAANAQQEEGGAPGGEAQRTGCLTKTTVRLSLLGTYPDITSLLEVVEQHAQTVRLTQLTLGLVSEGGAELNAGFVLTIFASEEDNKA